MEKKVFIIFALLVTISSLYVFPSCGGKKVVEQSLPPPSSLYTIGPEDVLQINVWNEPELSLTVPVRSDGKISMPLIHDVYVVGLTPLELKENLKKQLSQYVENATVSVIVTEINSIKIYVIGEVNNPGVFEIDSEINIVQAIAMAGGFTEWARKNKIKVLRKYRGLEQIFIIDYNKILSGKSPELNIPLQPGDTIVVP